MAVENRAGIILGFYRKKFRLKMMKIIYRNFTRLLSVGAFGAHCPIEVMSGFKWNKLLLLAEAYGVSDFICSGIVLTDGKLVPGDIFERAKGKMRPQKKTKEESDNKYTYSVKQKAKKFSSIYLNRRYNKLVFNEIHSIDTSVNSLILLNKLIDNINAFLDCGVNIRKLADLGFYLRTCGNKIDFVKVDNWIKALKISNMCNLIACHLVFLFGFENGELPFLKAENSKYFYSIEQAFEKETNTVIMQVRHDTMRHGNDVSINPIHKLNTHPLKYTVLFPVEATSRFVSNIFKSLSNIDE